ncbi:MAG: hypothetical protein V6Z82_03310 [Flavobacteriales bacterium]
MNHDNPLEIDLKPEDRRVRVKSVSLDSASFEFHYLHRSGEFPDKLLHANVLPKNADDQTATRSSRNTHVATIHKIDKTRALVKIYGDKGEAIIAVKTRGSGKTDRRRVRVIKNLHPK